MLYSISYDLRSPGRDYKTLTDELARLGAKRILQSHWVARRNNTTAAGLRDHFQKLIDSNDRLMVIEIGSNSWASVNLMSNPNEM